MAKYKLTWKDLTATDFKTYLFAMFKAFIPKKKIKSLDELEIFIQTKSAWVTQVTLYNYLKTRMGTRYVLHFENRFQNINWNIYYTDLPFNPSALSLYKWAPIAEELKTLDRKIVLNSMILKWDVIKQEFQNLVQF